MSDPSANAEGVTLYGADAERALSAWPAGLPPPKICMRAIVRDRHGKVFINRDEDMRHIHPDDWLNVLTEEDRQYLINKHGEHNKPTGV